MSRNQLDYVVPARQSLTELASSLKDEFHIRVEPEKIDKRTFYDTFDWRLYNNGSTLESVEHDHMKRVYWRAQKDEPPKIQLGVHEIPKFATDLPDGEFRDQLEKVQKVRELLPQVKIRIKRTPVSILNSDNKIIARVSLDEHWFNPSKTRAGRLLGKRLTLTAVKGYPEPFNKVQSFLEPMKLRPARDNILKLAMTESGKSASNSSSLRLFLDPDMSSESALKDIYLRLLKIMQANLKGAVKGRDIEYMHDYRVALRKTRSAMALTSGFFPDDKTEEFKHFFSELGDVTTPVRDLDVFKLKLKQYSKQIDKPHRKKLDELKEYLADLRNKAQKDFIKQVKSDDYIRSLKNWKRLVKETESGDGQPVHKLSNALITEAYNQVRDHGTKINNDPVTQNLHELRKQCKQLRYAIEFFQSLYPARDIRVLLNDLKSIQDYLGDINDYDVHISILREYKENSDKSKTIDAVKALIEQLESQLADATRDVSTSVESFISKDTQDRFKELFTAAGRRAD